MRYYHDIIVKPVMTEKSMNLQAENKYTFIVDKLANKTEIKNAVEKVFNVIVQKYKCNKCGHVIYTDLSSIVNGNANITIPVIKHVEYLYSYF